MKPVPQLSSCLRWFLNDTIMEWDEVCENTLIKAERSSKCTDLLCIYRHLAFSYLFYSRASA